MYPDFRVVLTEEVKGHETVMGSQRIVRIEEVLKFTFHGL